MCLFFSYGREYADPYLGHSIGPVAGYGVSSRAYYIEHLMNNDNLILLMQSFSLVSNPKLNVLQNCQYTVRMVFWSASVDVKCEVHL